MKQYQDGKSSDDGHGRIPLIYAIIGRNVDIVKLLIRAYPEGVLRAIGDEQNVRVKGLFGKLPLLTLERKNSF